MTRPDAPTDEAHADPLDRFVEAQRSSYDGALAEITRGRKSSHWMWYIFPQVEGLGFSSTSIYYAIRGADEARAYLAHPVLGPRLLACAGAALAVEGRSAHQIFGSPDDLKLRSSATLFASVSEPGSPFHRLIEKYFPEGPDGRTLGLLGAAGRP